MRYLPTLQALLTCAALALVCVFLVQHINW
jgi:hypothetical protein